MSHQAGVARDDSGVVSEELSATVAERVTNLPPGTLLSAYGLHS